MALSTLSPVTSLGPYSPASQPFQSSATQVQASFEKALIDIRTSEGDRVTLHHSSSHARLSHNVQWQDTASQGTAFTSQALDSHNFSFTVQGDLSAQELEDLGELFDSLSLIAADFYQGHLDGAVTKALNIGDRGSLSSLSATFSQTEITASQITTYQPQAIADLSRVDHDEQALAQQRQAQWHQILAYLEKRKLDVDHPQNNDAAPIKDHGQAILARIKKTLENHQRLAPLITKLAERALTDKQQDFTTNPPLKSPEFPANRDHGLEKTLSRFAKA